MKELCLIHVSERAELLMEALGRDGHDEFYGAAILDV